MYSSERDFFIVDFRTSHQFVHDRLQRLAAFR